MRLVKDHHHYNSEKNEIDDRVSKYEKYVIDLLLNSDVPDSERESSVAFELKHHHSCAQFARILARKRELSIDVCTVGALLHDIYVIVSGEYKDHAHNGLPIANSILNQIGLFNESERENILKIVYYHSEKDVFTDDQYIEFGKDVDVLDSFLYPNCFEYYLVHKKLPVFYRYIDRAKKIWQELNIPFDKSFSVLDNYTADNWLDLRFVCDESVAQSIASVLISETNESENAGITFMISRDDSYNIYVNSASLYSRHETKTRLDHLLSGNESSLLFNDTLNVLISKLERNAALVFWSALGVFETHSITDTRIKEIIASV